jgi:hypothetical protein
MAARAESPMGDNAVNAANCRRESLSGNVNSSKAHGLPMRIPVDVRQYHVHNSLPLSANMYWPIGVSA